ncbi:MAG: DUF4870 family protein [Xanthobacteraceae bacterium]
MTSIDPHPRAPVVSDTTLALVIYVLYFVGYFTGITAVVGVIMAHLQVGRGDAFLDTHYRFQIRTFWIGLLYIVVGTILTFVFIGVLVLAWWFIWSLIRCIKGVLALNQGQAITNPSSWLFG